MRARCAGPLRSIWRPRPDFCGTAQIKPYPPPGPAAANSFVDNGSCRPTLGAAPVAPFKIANGENGFSQRHDIVHNCISKAFSCSFSKGLASLGLNRAAGRHRPDWRCRGTCAGPAGEKEFRRNSMGFPTSRRCPALPRAPDGPEGRAPSLYDVCDSGGSVEPRARPATPHLLQVLQDGRSANPALAGLLAAPQPGLAERCARRCGLERLRQALLRRARQTKAPDWGRDPASRWPRYWTPSMSAHPQPESPAPVAPSARPGLGENRKGVNPRPAARIPVAVVLPQKNGFPSPTYGPPFKPDRAMPM